MALVRRFEWDCNGKKDPNLTINLFGRLQHARLGKHEVSERPA